MTNLGPIFGPRWLLSNPTRLLFWKVLCLHNSKTIGTVQLWVQYPTCWGPNTTAILVSQRSKYDCNPGFAGVHIVRSAQRDFRDCTHNYSLTYLIAVIFGPLYYQDCSYIWISTKPGLQSYLDPNKTKISVLFGPRHVGYWTLPPILCRLRKFYWNLLSPPNWTLSRRYEFWYYLTIVFIGLKLTFWNLFQLPNVFLSDFRNKIPGIWIVVVPVVRDHSSWYSELQI